MTDKWSSVEHGNHIRSDTIRCVEKLIVSRLISPSHRTVTEQRHGTTTVSLSSAVSWIKQTILGLIVLALCKFGFANFRY